MYIALESESFCSVLQDKEKENGKSQFYIADPGSKKIVCDKETMKKCWISTRLPGSVN